VPTQFDSAEALDLVSSMEGVTSVVNHLQVAAPEVAYVWDVHVFPYGPYVEGWRAVAPHAAQSDAQIVTRIQRELEWSPFVDASRVRVQVHDGKATLTGTVDSWREFRAAGEDAFEGGAISVDNQLKVG
jgi:osmotically-inducible protein OsmY